ncbi:M28 family peptidase [Bacteroidales bacterium OttesenSCG-928-M06]|nr:M28 family peptidase [Bacteroidales bacterium OttesenSCG-928-M06]
MIKNIILIVGFLLGMTACHKDKEKQNHLATFTSPVQITVPDFNADSAYHYTAKQVAFGPRVPNTQSHKDCGIYLVSELKRFGAHVIEQEVTLYTYDKKPLEAKNIIASFNPEHKSRVLLCAHWDSRPFADYDPDPKNHHTPIDGANDGAGACGILLEIARQIGISNINIGIDIILFDAEDWGSPKFENPRSSGWCLGSKYWSENPHTFDYSANYGILLDMASAKDAHFYKEYYSMYYANDIVKKVWETAHSLGHGEYFINKRGGGIEDDHIPINQIRRIPCIDIIQYDPDSETGFGHYWHTLSDTMDEVSKETMSAVGKTVMHVIYNEK